MEVKNHQFFTMFYDMVKIPGLEARVNSVKPSWAVAKQIGVKPGELHAALNQWGQAGYPQEYRYELERCRGSKKSYSTYLRVWSYQGGGDPGPWGVNVTGSVGKIRDYGDGHRALSDYITFCLEAVV